MNRRHKLFFQFLLTVLLHFLSNLLVIAADPPLLFPHGYFDSAKLKPFDAIYLNLLAQSSLEYGGVSLKELDRLDASRKLVARPPELPRTRVEDDKALDRTLPLDTDEIAPGPKEPQSRVPVDPFLSIGTVSSAGMKMPKIRPSTAITMIVPGEGTGKPNVTPNEKESNALQGHDANKAPPSPFRRIRHLQRRYRRAPADDEAEINPFEEIATRAPPQDQLQLQRARYYLRRGRRNRKKKRRNFLTRDDIYDPQRKDREEIKKEQLKRLREELALKPESEEVNGMVSEGLREDPGPHHDRRPQHAPTDESIPTDLRTTSRPHMPTLISAVVKVDRFPRLPNNPYVAIDISRPTVISLPIPPSFDNSPTKL